MMYFESLNALLVMDGHGVYVWAAYLVAFLVIVAVLVVPVRQRNHLLLQLGAELKRVRDRTDERGDG